MDVDAELVEALKQCVKSLDETSRKIDVSARQAPPAYGQIGNSNVNVQPAGPYMQLLFFASAFALGIALATSFNLASRMTHLENKQDADVQGINGHLKDITDEQTTLQAYINQIYRSQHK